MIITWFSFFPRLYAAGVTNVVKPVVQSRAGFCVSCPYPCFNQSNFGLWGSCIKSHLKISLNSKIICENDSSSSSFHQL